MRRQSPFRLAAKNSLKVTERDPKMDKELMHTLQGGYNLRQQLTRTVNTKTKGLGNQNNSALQSSKQQKQQQKDQQEVLQQEVAALDNFKAPVTRQKTRAMIQNIKLRRREKHLQAYGQFREDLDDYQQNLVLVYSSLQNDLLQVLSIKQNQLKEYFSSLSDQYLLTKSKEILQEISKQVSDFEVAVNQKLKQSYEECERIRADRRGVVDNKCQYLSMVLTDIAFVLEDEVKAITGKQKEEMQKKQQQVYNKLKDKLGVISVNQQKLFESLRADSNNLHERWKTLHEERQINNYLNQADGWQLRWPEKRVNLYKSIVELQNTNSLRKFRLISNLSKQHPDSLSKANIQKWSEHLKIINQAFDQELDNLIKQLMREAQESEDINNKRFQLLRQKLNYIQKRNPESVQELLKEKCQVSLARNIQESKRLLKDVTNYVEQAQERQNAALQKLAVFLCQVGSKNDEFSKKWSAINHQYQIQKAKILDDDDQTAQKLSKQLQSFKKQVRQALHHIKLEQVIKSSHEKIDQLEKTYRQTHQKNKELAAKRPQIINKFMSLFEARIAQTFSLYDQSKRAQLVQKSKKEAEEKAIKRLEEEEKKKQQQEAILAEQAKKKGGKAPPAAKKDPKKAQAEQQERKKVILQQIGLRQIEQVKTGSGSVWLAFRSLIQICSQFYKTETYSGDQLDPQITNCRLQPLVSQKALISSKQMAGQIQTLRNNIFSELGQKKTRLLQQSQVVDSSFIQQSLAQLDRRLRDHYPLKGKLQAELGVVRSGQITSHKKQYEKHVRLVKQKADLQTQKFNYLLQKSLELIKSHNADQKAVREQLALGKNLADFQSCFRKAHQNHKHITKQMEQISKQLNRLSSVQMEGLLNSNQQFLKKNKLLEDGGQFSTSQIEWYRQMMKQINDQISQQRIKRVQKAKEVQELIEKKTKELIQLFEKDYATYLEDLSAKQGTGKKYGRPKRIAQEKLRFEMNKCQQAQISIDNQINAILDIANQGPPHFPEKHFAGWRQRLMTLQTCIFKYAKHIEAIVPNCKARLMPRITRLQGVSDALLTPEEEEEDKKKIVQQLLQLGPLGQQKQDKPFIKFLQDIEANISNVARQIYGDKSVHIKGNDRIPDFLRLYIQNMRKNAEQFRQESVRHLRQSCSKLSDISNRVIGLFYNGLQTYYGEAQSNIHSTHRTNLQKLISQHEKVRGENLKSLRPNLSNPKCQEELRNLDEAEQKRQKQFAVQVKSIRKRFQDEHFDNASKFLFGILNNYEMLILFFDSIYLLEDFVKVAGDDVEEKVHLDAKRLLLIKQKGISIDANSERKIKKKWEGANCTIFNFGDKKFTNIVVKTEQPTKEKDKKGTKKQAKGAKVQQVAAVSADTSKAIETYKTWRQKSVYTNREQTLGNFGKQYQAILGTMTGLIEKSLQQNESFSLKWQAIARNLYLF